MLIRCHYLILILVLNRDKSSLTNEDQDRPETVVGNEVIRAIVEKHAGNAVRDYAEELAISSSAKLFEHLR